MNAKTIDFATAQTILASLTGSEELVLHDDPLQEIVKLCITIKEVIRGYGSGIPDDLPIKISTDVAQEIYLRCAQNNWSKREESKLSEIERRRLIKSILTKFSHGRSKKMLIHVGEELKDTIQVPDNFLLELDKLNNTDLNKRLDEWTSYGGELEELFDVVSQPPPEPKKQFPKQKKKLYMAQKITNFDRFVDRWKVQEKGDGEIEDLRDRWSHQLENLFKKAKRVPKGYPKKRLPGYSYIRDWFLPYLIYHASPKGQLKNAHEEGSIYEAYRNVFQTEKKISKRVPV